MILLSGRESVGRNVKYRAEGMQRRQSYKVQGSVVTKLLSLDCWHYPEVGFLEKKTHTKGESQFRSSSRVVCVFPELFLHRSKNGPDSTEAFQSLFSDRPPSFGTGVFHPRAWQTGSGGLLNGCLHIHCLWLRSWMTTTMKLTFFKKIVKAKKMS